MNIKNAIISARKEIDILSSIDKTQNIKQKNKKMNSLKSFKIENYKINQNKKEPSVVKSANYEKFEEKSEKTWKNKKLFTNSNFQRLEDVKKFQKEKEKEESDNSLNILDKLNKKLAKSFKNYNHSLKNKKANALKLYERAKSVNRSTTNESEDSIKKIISKTNQAEKLKKEILNKIKDKINKNHALKEEKFFKAQESLRKKEIIEDLRKKEIDKRLSYNQVIAEEKKNKIKLNLQPKFEKQRLKELNALNKCEKNKIIQ